ncbi:MAG: hypothetical protein V4574_13970 [Pseudomonadota bacterium]
MNDTAQAPVTLTREELYALVWELPMIRLGERFGVSGTGLAKICKRLDIPCPPRGHWMKLAAGKTSPIITLPPADRGIADRVTIAPWSVEQDARKPEVVAALAAASAARPPIAVNERLAQPHAIIAKWLADHERRTKEARAERDSWRRGLMMPTPFTDVDRRRHRILDALLKSLEREGIRLSDEGRWQLTATRGDDAIEFQLRERFKQVRRAPTADEKRWHSSREFVQELQPTGTLMFEIKTYLPSGLTRTWREAEEKPLESSLVSILQTMLAAFPLLEKRRLEREEESRRNQLAEQRRREAEQERQREDGRWRRFLEFAGDWRDAELARSFLAALKAQPFEGKELIAGRSLTDWLAWAEAQAFERDPLGDGPAPIFASIAEVHAWTYRD